MTPNEAASIITAHDKGGYINTSTLLIGVTGSGKTTLLTTAAEYLFETYGAISALYFSDLGGYPDRMNALVKMGLVWVFKLRSRGMDLSFETAQLASMGFWPAQVLNPMTGEVPHGVRMVSPTQRRWHQTCTCGAVRIVKYKAQLAAGQCENCKQRIAQASTKIVEEQTLTPGLDKIRMRMYDGITSMSEWYLQDLSKRTELAGEMGAIGGVVTSGDLAFRGNNRAQVGFAQTRAHELISNSLSIPNQIIMPIWTALSNETSDQSGRLTIVGPKLAGDAKTEIAGAWFGNTLEAATVEGERPGEKIRRLYLNEFIDEQGRRHILKHRSDPRYVPEHLSDAPYTAEQPPVEICTNFSLGVFFRHLEIADERALASAATRFPNAPGITSVPTSFDVESTPDTPATPATPTPNAGGLKRPAGGGLKRPAAAAPRSVPAPAAPPSAAPAAPPSTPASSPGAVELTAQDTGTAAAVPAETPEPPAAVEAAVTMDAPAAAPPVSVAETPQAAPAAPAAPAPAVRPAARPLQTARPAWPAPPGVKPGTARPMPPVRRPSAPQA